MALFGRPRTPPDPWRAHAVERFLDDELGDAYGVTAKDKRAMLVRFEQIAREVESGTPVVVHIALAEALLSMPPHLPGAVVECGTWKGASAAALSIVCERMGRPLYVCDSFQGLPDDGEQRHAGLHTGVYGHYKEGMFAGTLPEVRSTITKLGAVHVCNFIEGFFADSLDPLPGAVCFAFLDVDLSQSTRDCLKAIWPRLTEGGYLYSDDAGDLDVVKVFFDDAWWQAELGCAAPGFVGSGCGLPLNARHSSIGYTRKLGAFTESEWARVPFLHYPEPDKPEPNTGTPS